MAIVEDVLYFLSVVFPENWEERRIILLGVIGTELMRRICGMDLLVRRLWLPGFLWFVALCNGGSVNGDGGINGDGGNDSYGVA